MTEFVGEKDTNKVFTLSGGREVVSAERAKELLAEANIDDYSTVGVVRLSNKSITEPAAEILAEALGKCVNIHTLDISDCIAGRPEEEALRVLSCLCGSVGPFVNQLVEVNVSENALGEKGVVACRPVLIGKNMQRVYFCNNGMSAEAAALIGVLLAEASPPLTLLHFFNNMSGDGGGHALAKVIRSCGETLRDVRFSATRCMQAGCGAMLEALGTVKRLERVDISDNNYGAVSSANENDKKLVNSLGRHAASLQTLNLRDCGLGQDAIHSLLEAMTSALGEAKPVLRLLDLSGNELSEQFCCKTAGLLAVMAPALETLSLDDNDELMTPCEDDEEDELETAMRLSQSLAGALKAAPRLTLFSACHCELSSAPALLLCRALTAENVVAKLNGNNFSPAAVELLEGLDNVIMGELEDINELEDEEDEENLDRMRSMLEEGADGLAAEMKKLKV